MKGIILAGGTGSRLWPITSSFSKQLMPVYDKPLIYYPLSTLMLAGISEIAIVAKSSDVPHFKHLLSNGIQIGIQLTYFIQDQPRGIAQALLICEEFIRGQDVCLILGDNIFHGPGLGTSLQKITNFQGATVFAHQVRHPEQYGVIELSASGTALSIEEKPNVAKSKYVIPGLYFYDNNIVGIAKELKPSARGELEITDVNKFYLNSNSLNVLKLPRGTVWIDTGNPGDLLSASTYVQMIEERQGVKVSAPEEVAYRLGLINAQELINLCKNMPSGNYREYLESVASDRI